MCDGLGAVLSLLHIAPYFDGGTLSLDGGAAAVGDPITAHLEMQNLKITKSPVFAQLLRARLDAGHAFDLHRPGL